MDAYDEGKPLLAVDLGQESIDCPMTGVAEPKSSACPADQLLKRDNKEQGS
jgi:hypothetical protein